MSLRMQYVAIIGLGFSGAVQQLYAGAGDPIKDKFAKEAPAKWQEYMALARRFQGKVISKTRYKDNRAESQREIRQNRECALYAGERVSHRGEKQEPYRNNVWVLNADYCFELKKPTRDKAWQLELLRQDKEMDLRGVPIAEEILNLAARPLHLFDRKLPSFIQESEFRISDVKEVRRESRTLIQVDFTYTHPVDPKNFRTPVQGGSMVLDPARYWCITECTAKFKWSNTDCTYSCKNEFKKDTEPPIIAQMREVTTYPDRTDYAVMDTTFDFYMPDVLPPNEEFLISQFGFAEPHIQARATPVYIWLVLGGIACFLGSLAFRWFKRNYPLKTA